MVNFDLVPPGVQVGAPARAAVLLEGAIKRIEGDDVELDLGQIAVTVKRQALRTDGFLPLGVEVVGRLVPCQFCQSSRSCSALQYNSAPGPWGR